VKKPRILEAPVPSAVLLALLALTGACSLIPRARPEPTRFYTLSLPVPPHPINSAPLTLGVGPIAFPSYLDQSQLVHRLADERVAYAPADRWAGPLRGQFERALVLRLMAELDTDEITTFPWWPKRHVDAAVRITLLSFETDASGMARLDALWKVGPGNRDDVLVSGQTSIREPVAFGGGAEAEVAALDRALAQLAQAIAIDVRRAVR
jgi:uncharacterized lipoprotein YmbA